MEKLKLIQKENLIQLLNTMKETSNIKNATQYLMICLYNNLGYTYNPAQASLENSLRKGYEKTNWDDFYDNGWFDRAIKIVASLALPNIKSHAIP